jgi:hypothetical protein
MNRKLIMPILVLLLVGAVVWLGFLIARPRANVQIITNPHPAIVTIDGAKKVSRGTLYLSPGSHTLTASYEGFASKSLTFSITKGKPLQAVFLLTPNSAAGKQYLKDNPGEQSEREQLGGEQYDTDSATIRRIYPILSLLPHQGIDFAVNYGASVKNPKDPYAVALYVQVPAKGQEARALNWIRFSGYNPDDYEIVYQYQGESD